MFDSKLTIDILEQTHNATILVEERFISISSVDDFNNNPIGKITLDSICMQLIVIGDSLKKIDQLTKKKLLRQYDQIDWAGAKGTRDIIAHHYFDIDAQQIYFICANHINPLKTTLAQIIIDLKQIKDL